MLSHCSKPLTHKRTNKKGLCTFTVLKADKTVSQLRYNHLLPGPSPPEDLVSQYKRGLDGRCRRPLLSGRSFASRLRCRPDGRLEDHQPAPRCVHHPADVTGGERSSSDGQVGVCVVGRGLVAASASLLGNGGGVPVQTGERSFSVVNGAVRAGPAPALR